MNIAFKLWYLYFKLFEGLATCFEYSCVRMTKCQYMTIRNRSSIKHTVTCLKWFMLINVHRSIRGSLSIIFETRKRLLAGFSWLICLSRHQSDQFAVRLLVPSVLFHDFHGISVPVRLSIFKYMMKSSNGNIFRVTGPLCGEVTG